MRRRMESPFPNRVWLMPKKTCGGARKGAGRKPALPGAKTVTVSVTLPPDVLARIDRERGAMSRGRWITARV